MNSSKSVTANFARLGETKFSLIITASGEGTVVPARRPELCLRQRSDSDCGARRGWQFSGWTGKSMISRRHYKILMTGNQSSGQLYSDRVRFEYSSGGRLCFPSQSPKLMLRYEVDITALPAAGWRFSGWSGDVTDPVHHNYGGYRRS